VSIAMTPGPPSELIRLRGDCGRSAERPLRCGDEGADRCRARLHGARAEEGGLLKSCARIAAVVGAVLVPSQLWVLQLARGGISVWRVVAGIHRCAISTTRQNARPGPELIESLVTAFLSVTLKTAAKKRSLVRALPLRHTERADARG
jgi:hypothetical protein